MKKLFLLALATAFSMHVAAQQPVKFGVKAGLTLPHMTISALGASYSFDSKTSFYVGGIADVAFSKVFSVQPGLSLVNKGTKVSSSGFEFEDDAIAEDEGTINLMYLEIPVNLLANFKTGQSGKVFFGAGPYYAFAINGTTKAGNEKEDITFGSDEDNLKRGDFGFNFMAGYQLDNGLNLHLNYGLGISSVLHEQEYNLKFKNRVFSVGLGFNF
ncbi:MAG: porin family protein [Pedobacter sp.]|nr:porin family protein [Pedobacter sp.]MDQ8053405.1 porin family protein [Pedobacter sp.]